MQKPEWHMVSRTCSWMGETGTCLVQYVQRREESKAKGVCDQTGTKGEKHLHLWWVTQQSLRHAQGAPNFETWIPSSHELWNGKAFITTAVALLFHLGEEIQDRFLWPLPGIAMLTHVFTWKLGRFRNHGACRPCNQENVSIRMSTPIW